MPPKSGKPKTPEAGAKTKAKAPRKRRATAKALNPQPLDSDDPVREGSDGVPAAAGDDAIELSDFRPLGATDHDDAPEDGPAPAIEIESGSAEDHGALVPIDPLNRYLSEIRRFPLLSREQETEIARRYVELKDPADAYRLVTANLRLVVKIAYEFARATRNVLDLIQEGNVGLMEAVKNFEPERGIRFPSYAVWWVRAYIYRYLINNWRLVKIGTTQAQRKLFFNLRKESERLEQQGFSAQPLLLAHRMGVKESEVREMQERMGQSEVSLDQPTGASDDSRLLDVIPDSEHNPETETADREWRDFAHDQVERFTATLEGKELEIFKARLLAEDPETLQDIGARFGISRERVRQIETRLKTRLREFIEHKARDIDDAGPS